MIQLKNVSKFYYSKGVIAAGFSKINLEFHVGEFVAITGESGSGKSTLLNVLSGLDSYEEGEMYVYGGETSHYMEKDWEDYRRKYIGNIYQNFNLINSYSVYRNVELALSLNGVSKRVRKKKVLDLLKKVDMLRYKNTKVSKLSGGQKQRIAIARALAKDVPVIIADEPTGNLDKNSALKVFKILEDIAKDKLVIVVTHNFDQVEPYATRKIVMHDGKVIEDRSLKDTKKIDLPVDIEYGSIRLFDKLQLGFINTFNVLPKFILLFCVYAFLVIALMAEYSSFKQAEYEMSKLGLNYIFIDTNDHRIILNKNDKSSFSDEEIQSIKQIRNVDYIVENDALVDQVISWTTDDEELWFSCLTISNENFRGEITYGRMPENENEILLEGPSLDYYLSYEIDKILNQSIYKVDSKGEVDKTHPYTVVGVLISDDMTDAINVSEYRLYVGEQLLNDLQFMTHEVNSTVTIDFMGTNHVSSPYVTDFRLEANNWVTPGTAIVSEDYNSYCDKNNCLNKTITITTKNLYYEDVRSFSIEKLYNKNNIIYTLEIPNYSKDQFNDLYNGIIYINPLDYNQIFNKGTYQMSVYVKDIELMDDTDRKLQSMGYRTLQERNTLANTYMAEFVKIEKVIVTIILIIVLFFISYFIIKLILKSRNVYYAILRMLGASRRACRQLLMFELLTICNLSYFLFTLLVRISFLKNFHISILDMVYTYFKFSDYVTLYVVLTGMSILISARYSRKLFKTSAMATYREEV